MATVASIVSDGKGDGLVVPSNAPMKTKNTKETWEEVPDFDLEKLFRGELGPNVAEELAAK